MNTFWKNSWILCQTIGKDPAKLQNLFNFRSNLDCFSLFLAANTIEIRNRRSESKWSKCARIHQIGNLTMTKSLSPAQAKNLPRTTLLHADSKVRAFCVFATRRREFPAEPTERSKERGSIRANLNEDKAEQDKNVCAHKTHHQHSTITTAMEAATTTTTTATEETTFITQNAFNIWNFHSDFCALARLLAYFYHETASWRWTISLILCVLLCFCAVLCWCAVERSFFGVICLSSFVLFVRSLIRFGLLGVQRTHTTHTHIWFCRCLWLSFWMSEFHFCLWLNIHYIHSLKVSFTRSVVRSFVRYFFACALSVHGNVIYILYIFCLCSWLTWVAGDVYTVEPNTNTHSWHTKLRCMLYDPRDSKF